MSKTVIKIENLSKIYRLGEIGTGTLSHDLNRWFKMNILGKDDPYAKVGHVNDRTQKAEKGELVAALRDINLEVKEGEVLGIIGKNGAGKSTLLKLLSRVTSPTTGTIKVKGRLASLLEVGTGFHPEMTGRENIYMNGTIMGMRKWEIDKQLDAIVEFAGVAKYLDTPTKRYSSGMTVRLGFAIAAHLEPEILVVDEVLAVGDAEFQKKAIGKMQDVSKNDGRTVLFVSHNMTSVKSLCNSAILLENGIINKTGQTEDVINYYLKNNIVDNYRREWTKLEAPGTKDVKIHSAFIEKNTDLIFMSTDFSINYKIGINKPIDNFAITYHLINENENIVWGSSSMLENNKDNKGEFMFTCFIPGNLMNAGFYSIKLLLVHNAKAIHIEDEILSFTISDDTLRKGWHGKLAGIVRPELKWKINHINNETKL